MKIIKTTVLVLLIIAVSLFTACGGGSGGSGGSSDGGTYYGEPGFDQAEKVGDVVHIDAGDEEFAMAYANNEVSIIFPFSPALTLAVDDEKETIDHKFFMGETEVTYAVWYEVKQWAATDAGDSKRADGGELYTFQNQGREGSTGTDGDAPTANSQHPVTRVSWRDALIWCNALSEMTGAEVVYVANGNHGTVDGDVLRSSTTGAYDGHKIRRG